MLRLWPLRFVGRACHPETACLSPWNRGEPEDGDKYRIDNGSHVLESWSVKISHVRDWVLRKSWSNFFPSPTKLEQLYLLVQQKVGPTIGNLDRMTNLCITAAIFPGSSWRCYINSRLYWIFNLLEVDSYLRSLVTPSEPRKYFSPTVVGIDPECSKKWIKSTSVMNKSFQSEII